MSEHGLWNRNKKSGYRVTMVTLKGNEVTDYKTFVSGWLEVQSSWGRPAYVLVLADGSMLISDDKVGEFTE